ncbi:MAG: metallophosphoesterase [Eubacteriales bacterium]|nr:metallophosphoesterase [Eubacteriales bacterium]
MANAINANKIKIMQLGDVHLGGAYRSLPEDLASVCRSALLCGFVNAVTAEIKNGVSVVLITGDLFDSDSPDQKTADAVRELFFKNPDVVFFIAPGESDFGCPLWQSGLLPDNVTVFTSSSPKRIVLSEKKLEIYGWSAKKKAKSNQPLSDRKAQKSELPKIVMGHCDINNPIGSSFSVTAEDMKDFGADFYAFSHNHKSAGIKHGDGYSYSFSGFFDGRGFDETGWGSYILITVDRTESDGESKTSDYTLTARRKETKIHRYESITVNADGAKSTAEAENKILDVLTTKKFDTHTSVRAIITGSVSPDVIITKHPTYIHPPLFSIVCVNETAPTFECDDLKNDKSILGEVFRKFLGDMTSRNRAKRTEAASAFRAAYMALTGKDINNA